MPISRASVVPVVVALPLFLQNLDSSVITLALPAMAQSLGVAPLRLNLAITVYLVSLALFLPASGWLADRYGGRRVFCAAIAIFAAASALCASARSLELLVAYRVLQGMGGAMMVPVGRLILLRNVAPQAMVTAMVWFTVPPAMGRLVGPLVGGMVVTWASWHWIFLINVPLGLLAIGLALWLVDPTDAAPEHARSFDVPGFLLLGVGIAATLAALQGAGSQAMDAALAAQLGVLGAACLLAYFWHSRRAAQPLVDLTVVRHRTFAASVLGAAPLRLALGAVPFLLPLMLQLGFGLSALQSGSITVATAIGGLSTRLFVRRALRAVGFRGVLIGATLAGSASYAVYATFSPATPHGVIFGVLLVGGLVMSMAMVSLQTLAYTEIPPPHMGHATVLAAMSQQLCTSMGVLMAVEVLRVSAWSRGGTPAQLVPADFSAAFLSVAALVLLALVSFRRLPRDTGAQLRE